jgi:hypothetical protein
LLLRAIRLGTAAFVALVVLGGIALAAVFWHHRTLASPRSEAGAEAVHIDVLFVFAAPPLALVASAVVVWLFCVGTTYLLLFMRR